MAYRKTQAANGNNVIPPGTFITLVIPWAEKWQTRQEIEDIFRALDWGHISKVDIIPRTTKRPHNTVYIHFSRWFDDHCAKTAYNNFMKGNYIKVFYNSTYFWKVLRSDWRPKPTYDLFVVPRIEVVEVNTQPSTSTQDNEGDNVPESPTYLPQSPTYLPSPEYRPPNPVPTDDGDDKETIPSGAANCHGCEQDLENQQGHYGGCIDIESLSTN